MIQSVGVREPVGRRPGDNREADGPGGRANLNGAGPESTDECELSPKTRQVLEVLQQAHISGHGDLYNVFVPMPVLIDRVMGGYAHRTAISVRIGLLRKAGYRIESQHRLGYRLVPSGDRFGAE